MASKILKLTGRVTPGSDFRVRARITHLDNTTPVLQTDVANLYLRVFPQEERRGEEPLYEATLTVADVLETALQTGEGWPYDKGWCFDHVHKGSDYPVRGLAAYTFEYEIDTNGGTTDSGTLLLRVDLDVTAARSRLTSVAIP